ncbi:MAG: hypothetical protein MJ108_04435 [Saccharofermentans sp.]|nr:hypothetical protein [Saccharofermentans sp.]
MRIFTKVVSMILIASISLGMVACSDSGSKKKDKKDREKKEKTKVEEWSIDDFEDFLDDYTDGDYFDRDYDNCYGLLSDSGDVVINYRWYDDEDDAEDYFDVAYSGFEEDFDDDLFDGKHDMKRSGSQGYVVLAGEGEDDGSWIYEDQYFYGGVYYADHMVVTIITTRDKDKAREHVDEVLKELNFPRP